MGNLLSNAVRLAPSGSAITVATGSRGGWAWTAVRDEGPGIPEAERDRVFERFHRVAGGDRGGSGLGLAIARQIVESHEGRLALFASGAGSTFVIWIPDRATVAPDRRRTPPAVDPLG